MTWLDAEQMTCRELNRVLAAREDVSLARIIGVVVGFDGCSMLRRILCRPEDGGDYSFSLYCLHLS